MVDWLSLWDNSLTHAQLIGLLHAGFDVPIGPSAWSDDAVARLKHYLAYAPGWHANPRDFHRDDEPYEPDGYKDERRRQNRQEIAEKAFKMVAQHVLKPTIKRERWDRMTQMSLEGLALSPAFAPLLEFFEPTQTHKLGQPRLGNIGYAPYGTHATWARQALLGLCQYGLGLDTRDIIVWPIDAYREKYGAILIRILAGLGELDLLLDERQRAPLAASAWTQLRKLALGHNSPKPAPTTLQDNIAACNTAASVYLTLAVRRRVIAINV